MLSSRETARKLGLSNQTVLKLAKDGSLPGAFIAHRWRFDPESIDNFVAANRRVGK